MIVHDIVYDIVMFVVKPLVDLAEISNIKACNVSAASGGWIGSAFGRLVTTHEKAQSSEFELLLSERG